ncbi:MAG: hypothetical protein QGH37_06850 [Candidatus Poribacteria bacterium]|nr:hypothetical protein [Candidatus Poribacteria bacterium]MDP6997914.1 hypothetical protein [Candidatus Poribacteria bacterium]
MAGDAGIRGRWIKQTINLNLSRIKFCDQQMPYQFAEIQYIADYIKQKAGGGRSLQCRQSG